MDYLMADGTESAAFRIEVRAGDTHNLLVLAGLIGLDAAPQLRDEAERLAARSEDVAIDWRDVEHVGAAAMQVLLALGTALSGSGRKLYVVADNAGLRGYLELAGLSGSFPEGR